MKMIITFSGSAPFGVRGMRRLKIENTKSVQIKK